MDESLSAWSPTVPRSGRVGVALSCFSVRYVVPLCFVLKRLRTGIIVDIVYPSMKLLVTEEVAHFVLSLLSIIDPRRRPPSYDERSNENILYDKNVSIVLMLEMCLWE